MMHLRLADSCPLVVAALRMRGSPATIVRISDALCLTRAETQRALYALLRVGLAERVDDGWRLARSIA